MRSSTLPAARVCVLLLTLASGCASTAPPAAVPSPPLGNELPRYDADTPPAPIEEPKGKLSLPDALALALLHNPRLLAFSWELRAREAEALQAGLWPNPQLDAELENFGGSGIASGIDGAEATLSLSQLVELGGKRSKRLEVASLHRDLAAWDYEGARIDVLTETTEAFVAVLAAQEQLVLAEELREVAERVLNSVQRRVAAGATSAVEKNRARVAVETARVDRDRQVRNLSVARQRLTAQWGGLEPSFDSVAAKLEELRPLPPLAALVETIDQNPALARWTTELTRRRAEKELAGAGRVPDLSVGAGLRHFGETGDVGAIVGISLPLPTLDRKQGAIAAAQSRIVQAEHARRSVATDVRTQMQAAHAEALSSFEEATSLRDRAIPEAEAAFELAEQFYSRGRMPLTDVLDTERTLFELRVRYVDALLRYHTAATRVERLAGAPLSAFDPDQRRPER